ncbi:MAG: hypothetical protein C4341_07185 [Armatimonadota bacterium]
MWEFGVRILAAGGVIAVAGWTGLPPFEVAWKVGALAALLAFLTHHLERSGRMNPGVGGLIAGADAFAIACGLAAAGAIGAGGALALVPIVYAIAKRGSYPAATGAFGAGGLLLGAAMGAASELSSAVYLHVAGALLVAIVANQPRITERPKTVPELLAESDGFARTGVQTTIELRAKVRKLQRMLGYIEKAARVDRLVARTMLFKQGLPSLALFVEGVAETTDADGVILHTFNASGDRLVLSSWVGISTDEQPDHTVRVSKAEAAHRIKARLREALIQDALLPSGVSTRHSILHHRGEVVGVLTLIARRGEDLETMQERIEEAAEALGGAVHTILRIERLERRMREAELLYEIHCRLDGAVTVNDLCQRTAVALKEALACDDVNILLFAGGNANEPTIAGRAGRAVPILENLRFEGGIDEWIAGGSPTIAVYDVTSSSLMDPGVASRLRVGAYILAAFGEPSMPLGVVIASSRIPGAFHSNDSRVVLAIAAELSRVAEQIANLGQGAASAGLLTHSEFRSAVVGAVRTGGCILHVEPLHLERVAEHAGAGAAEQVVRRLGVVLRRHAPADARILRHDSSTYVVLLAGAGREAAERVASHLSAVAAMESVDIGSDEEPVLLAVRVRTADLDERIEQNRISGSFTG